MTESDPRPLFYVLDEDGNAVPEPDTLTWGHRMELGGRIVGRTVLPTGHTISTVFLGLDHNFARQGPPILWETMIWTGSDEDRLWLDYQERYTSRADAIAGHTRAIDMILNGKVGNEPLEETDGREEE